MDAVTKQHDRPSTEYSQLLSVGEIKVQMAGVYSRQCQEGLAGMDKRELKATMNVSDSDLADLESTCSVDKLLPREGFAALQALLRRQIPADTGLESVNDTLKDSHSTRLDLMSIPSTPVVPSPSLIQLPEVLLSVLIFHPAKKTPMLEYLVFGSQKLTELRDKIFCSSDYIINKDYSDNPDDFDRDSIAKPPSQSKSAFFFINNTFYNDLRHADSTDLSSAIIEWAGENSERVNQSVRLNVFSVADMATTTFDQLSLRLGYPYLYCHHGNCEHLMAFTDMRLLSPTDNQLSTDYPLMVAFQKRPRRKCCGCDKHTAIWATVNDDLATEIPAHFCGECFKMLHYDKEGKKICNFQAYPFFDEATNMVESASLQPPPSTD